MRYRNTNITRTLRFCSIKDAKKELKKRHYKYDKITVLRDYEYAPRFQTTKYKIYFKVNGFHTGSNIKVKGRKFKCS